jgi:hypothetical protein
VVLICVGSVIAAVALLVAAVVLLGVQISGFGFHRRSAPSSSDFCSWNSFRLPPHTVPAHYNLTFDVSFEQPAQVADTCSRQLCLSCCFVRPSLCSGALVGLHVHSSQVDGKADISLDVRESSHCIVLHAAHLNITSVQFASQTGAIGGVLL